MRPRRIIAVVALSLLTSSFARSESDGPGAADIVAPAAQPRAPCGHDTYPAYPALDGLPEVTLWTAGELGPDWMPPSCAGWPNDTPSRVVALAANIVDGRDMDRMLSDIGAISRLDGIRYWSVTDRRWNRLFTKASALESPKPETVRADFAPSEIRAAHDLYFRAADNRSGENAVWHLHIMQMQRDRIVFNTANVTPLKWWFVPVVSHGGIETTYFLDRDPRGSWRVYTLTRVLYASPVFAYFVPAASYINRALALYRHFAGLPDSAPATGNPINSSVR